MAGITHILITASKINPRFKNDFNYKILELLDVPTQNIVQYFEESSNHIEEVLNADPKNKILIHCFAGKSRASTITCAYLMRKRNMPLKDALLHLKACRPVAFPNLGFLVQLKAYESTIFGKCSAVPLKLEQLFGIVGKLKQEGEETEKKGATADESSDAKALNDAKEVLD